QQREEALQIAKYNFQICKLQSSICNLLLEFFDSVAAVRKRVSRRLRFLCCLLFLFYGTLVDEQGFIRTEQHMDERCPRCDGRRVIGFGRRLQQQHTLGVVWHPPVQQFVEHVHSCGVVQLFGRETFGQQLRLAHDQRAVEDEQLLQRRRGGLPVGAVGRRL